MARASGSFLGLVLGGCLLAGGLSIEPLSAQDERVKADPPDPVGSEIAFEWQYSCTSGRACSFNCVGSGGASSVTKLLIQLRTIPLGAKNAAGIFYEYATIDIPRANGFNITTGISILSCQVNGMNLVYSGSPKKNEPPDVLPKKIEAPAVTSSLGPSQ